MADDDIKPGAEGEDIEAEVAPDGVNASQTDAEAESADSSQMGFSRLRPILRQLTI